MSEFSSFLPPHGIVDLKDKQIPVCETPPPFHTDYAFTRAVVDTTGLKNKLLNLSPDMWEDEKHSEGNVKLTRPAHDAWGIKKIVFTFCDDFLLKVFDLPWSQAEEWRMHLLPIYQAIGVDESKVVRCLLASMPPGMSIPVHHDTGYWVKHTHRCHVAIVSRPEVSFFVGPTNDTLRKISFNEGHVVELNNQAKHAVTNGMADTWRIHLIFDYVESHPLIRYVLKPGEKLNQTRRSIDLARHEGTRQVPSFIVIGAQKCGTTSLYELLCEHPLVVRGKRRETHFFDWRWPEHLDSDAAALSTITSSSTTTTISSSSSTAPSSSAYFEEYKKYYNADALFKYPSLLTGESTPSYLLHSDFVIPRINAVCPWVKLLVVLRNPVDRAYSQYQMCNDPNGTPEQLQVRGMSAYKDKTFDVIVEEEIAELEALGIHPDTSYEVFRDRFLSTRRGLKHGGHSIIARGLYALQLMPWLMQFSAEGRTQTLAQNESSSQIMVLTISQLKASDQTTTVTSSVSASTSSSSGTSSSVNVATAASASTGGVQHTMNDVYRFVGIPPHDITNVEPRNTRSYDTLSPQTRARLASFYAPYNRQLVALLAQYPSSRLPGSSSGGGEDGMDW